MVDTWVAGSGDNAGVTLSSANPFAPRDAWQIDQRIDYVMARPGIAGDAVIVHRAFTAGDPTFEIHPSDHYANVTDMDP